MSKKSARRKSLTPEEVALGKKRIYVIIGMMIIGLAVAMYSMQ